MAENLGIAVQMTIIGTGLVFGAILLLWGALVLLVRVLPEKAEAGAGAAPGAVLPAPPPAEAAAAGTRPARAAAAAVAVALAREAGSNVRHFPAPPTATVSAWQAVMRGRQLKEQRGRIR
jgi:uncharacterized membrane protein